MAAEKSTPVSRLQMRIADGIIALAKAIGTDETIFWLKGLTAAFADGMLTPEQKKTRLLAELAQLERKEPGALHSVARLRQAVNWTPDAFNDAIVELLESKVIGGHETDLITDAVRSDAVLWRGLWIVGIYPRR